ncbi:MAG: HepT-like ribonuclease domain-containing protein [Actinomycetota bacterium]
MDERDRDLLEAIAAAGRLALGYVREQGPGWLDDPKTVDAVAKRVDEVGELAKRVRPEVLTAIPDVDWRGGKAFREVLAHGYGDLDRDVLADIVATRLPGLVEAVERTLRA